MRILLRFFNQSGVIGSFIAAMGCASCFPALGSVASALGIGFLAQFEGVFINTLLPVFALLAVIISLVMFWRHRQWVRFIISITGPIFILLTLYPLWRYSWSTDLFYVGLMMMLVVAIWDMVSPATRSCKTSGTTHNGQPV